MDNVSRTLDVLLKTYPGKGAVELEDPFKVLFATIVSQRNRDELTKVVAARLFENYPDVDSLAEAAPSAIAQLIYPAGFYNQKAKRIVQIAKILQEKFSGRIPDNMTDLLTLPGVGRKTANCVLAFGYKIPAIVVDTHVFRVPQRLGWLRAKNVNEAEASLEKLVPKRYWLDINRVIVQHGKAICRPVGPKCQDCPILSYCEFGLKKAAGN